MKNEILIIMIAFVLLFLAGCSSKKGIPFAELVEDKVVKITMRHPGSGLLYTTNDENLMGEFITQMEHGGGDYYESEPVALAGNSIYHLYNEEGREVAAISFYEELNIKINDKFYSVKSDVKWGLSPFFEEFLNDKNIVNEE